MIKNEIRNNYSEKILIIFDFDETITDKDSEYEQARMTLSENEYKKIIDLDHDDYYRAFNYFFKKMKELGLALNDINSNLEKLELSPKIKDLFEYLKLNKNKYEIIILSGDIDYTIKYVLKYHGYLDLFDEIICNKAIIQNNNSAQLIYVPNDQFPHSCNDCIFCQCKSNELQKFLDKKGIKYKRIIFICDGGNDICPCKKILKNDDIVFPRLDHWFYERMINENIRDELKCHIYPWKSADEIIFKLKNI